MKLSTQTLDFIQKVVDTAELVGIDSIIIEPNMVRGAVLEDSKTVVICHEGDIPALPFGSIGLTRTNTFSSRLRLARSQDGFNVEAKLDDSGDFVRSLIMKGKSLKIDYRCASPTTIKAPKKIIDPMQAEVQLTSEAVYLLAKGQAAMGNAEFVTVLSNSDGVSFQIVDVNNDYFSHTFADSALSLNGGSSKFAFTYPLKTLMPLFKTNTENTFKVGQKGLMINVNGLDIYTLAMV